MRTLFATDFDGTLYRSGHGVCDEDLQALNLLRSRGCVTVLATGRSPFSLDRALNGLALPFCWRILSSGAGIVDEDGVVVRSLGLSSAEVSLIRGFLEDEGFDYSAQGPFPSSHLLYYGSRPPHPDHARRRLLYPGFTFPVEALTGGAAQFVVYLAEDEAPEALARLRAVLEGDFQVIRTTSPLDHRTVWVEVFPHGVNKGSALGFLAERLGIPRGLTAALGNDWNDVHLLQSVGTSFVVQDAPPGLFPEAIVVPGPGDHGVRDAASLWLEMHP